MKKHKRTIVFVILFVLLDQAIKIFISRNLMNIEFNIFYDIIGFQPYLNIDYSWINSLGNFGVNRLAHIIMVVLVLICIGIAYDYLTNKWHINVMTYFIFIFLFSGGICSFIDKIAWGGSLDYILLKGFFIFDLKDVYLSVSDVMIVLMFIYNYKKLKDMKTSVLFYDLIRHLKGRFLIIRHKSMK